MWYLIDGKNRQNRKLYGWEFENFDNNSHHYTIGQMGNPHIGQKPKPAVFVKTKFIRELTIETLNQMDIDYHRISSA